MLQILLEHPKVWVNTSKNIFEHGSSPMLDVSEEEE